MGNVEIAPASATLDALEATVSLTATVRSVSGQELSRTVDWRSTNPAVARVVDGTVTSRSNGSAEIVASVSDAADTATVTVRQIVDAATVEPEALELRPGESGQLEAEAVGPNGHPVTDARFTWTTLDADVASVDSTGRVIAVEEGSTTITATPESAPSKAVSAAVTVSTADPSLAPTISSAGPLREGAAATVVGTNFRSEPVDNTATLDGVELTVLEASPTELRVDVPDLGCLPAREGTLGIATFDGSAAADVRIEPDEAPLQLPVGEQLLITDPGAFCLQFEESVTPNRYLVGVQSLSNAVDGLTPVQVVAEAADGEISASRSPARLSAPGGASAEIGNPGSSPVAPAASVTPSLRGRPALEPFAGRGSRQRDRRARHRAAERRIRSWERAHLEPRRAEVSAVTDGRTRPALALEDPDQGAGTDPSTGSTASGASPSETASLRLSVAADVSVGDTVALRVPDLRSSDLCADWVPVDATVRAVGERAFLLGDVENPVGGLTAADYEDLAERIDRDIFDTQVAYFGEPSDIDGNDRIVVLYTREVNRVGDGALGFAFAGDYFPRTGGQGGCESSDEGEIFYARAPDPEGELGAAFSREDAVETAPPLMAHELTHVIQQSRRLQQGHSFMSSVVAEAQANLSEEIVGHAVTGRSPGQNLGFRAAFNPDDTDEVDWYADAFGDLAVYFGYAGQNSRVREAPDACGWWRDDASPCRGRPLWYGVGWSFLRWISDHHGPAFPGGESGLQRALIDNDLIGLENVVDVVGEPLDEMMARWAAALYVDDRIPGADPELTFRSWDFLDVFESLVPTARLQPFEEGYRDWTAVGDIRASSAGYVLLDGAGGLATALRIRNRSDGILPGSMQVWVVRLN